MGQTTTQSRSVGGARCRTYVNGALIANSDLHVEAGVGSLARQVTTSFRSGKHLGQPGERDDVEEQTASATSVFDFYNKVIDESRSGPQSSYDNGHPFSTQKSYMAEFSSIDRTDVSGSTKTRYVGPVICMSQDLAGGTIPSVPAFDSTVYGTRAIAATEPTRSIGGVTRAIFELWRDGLPRFSVLPGGPIDVKTRFNPGQNFIDWKFGFEPTIEDVKRTAYAVRNQAKLIRQFRRDSGRLVRRSFTFPVESSISAYPPSVGRMLCLSASGATKPWDGSNTGISPYGTLYETVETTRLIRFSGGYTYYLPIGNDLIDRMERRAVEIDHVLGLKADLELIWQELPYSWFVDWKLDIGALLHNLGAFSNNGLVLRYGYVMCETTVKHTCTVAGPTLKTGESGPWVTSYITHKKERVQATPYGFGLNPSSFSDTQWAILVALGIARVGKLLG